jgi:hypothetical protein
MYWYVEEINKSQICAQTLKQKYFILQTNFFKCASNISTGKMN